MTFSLICLLSPIFFVHYFLHDRLFRLTATVSAAAVVTSNICMFLSTKKRIKLIEISEVCVRCVRLTATSTSQTATHAHTWHSNLPFFLFFSLLQSGWENWSLLIAPEPKVQTGEWVSDNDNDIFVATVKLPGFWRKKTVYVWNKIDIPSNWQHRRSAICIDLTNQMYKEKRKKMKTKRKEGKNGKRRGRKKTATLLTKNSRQIWDLSFIL